MTAAYNTTRHMHYYIVSKPGSGIKTIKDLKGKKVGVFSLGHATLQYAKFSAKGAGLNPESDVAFLAVGQGVQAATALYEGRVDALSLWDSELATMEDIGYKLNWLPAVPIAKNLFGVTILVRDNFLKTHRSLAVGFFRSIAKGTIFLLENPREAIKIHYKLYPESLSKRKPMDQVMKEMIRGVKMRAERCYAIQPEDEDKRWGAYTKKEWDTYLDFLGLKGKIKNPYKYYTNELIDEVNKFDAEKIRALAHSFNFEAYEKKRKGK